MNNEITAVRRGELHSHLLETGPLEIFQVQVNASEEPFIDPSACVKHIDSDGSSDVLVEVSQMVDGIVEGVKDSFDLMAKTSEEIVNLSQLHARLIMTPSRVLRIDNLRDLLNGDSSAQRRIELGLRYILRFGRSAGVFVSVGDRLDIVDEIRVPL